MWQYITFLCPRMLNNRFLNEAEQCYEDWSMVLNKMEAYRKTVLDYWTAQNSVLMSSDMRIKVSRCVNAGKGDEESVVRLSAS